jgi:multidrug resistance efflux pump
MRVKPILIATLGALTVLAVGALLYLRGGHHPVPAPPVVTSHAPLILQGKIRPQHIVGVAAPVPGRIESLLVEPGADVHAGQPLARIGVPALSSSREAAQADLERAQEMAAKAEAAANAARLELSRADADSQRAEMQLQRTEKLFTRQQVLFDAGATPRLTFEKAQADYAAARKDYETVSNSVRTAKQGLQSLTAEAANAKQIVADKVRQLEEAKDSLAGAEVHSPVDGYVVSRQGEIGDDATAAGSGFFQIATDLSALEAVIDLKPDQLARVAPGMPAFVTVLELEMPPLQGVVREVKANQAIVAFNIVAFNGGTPAIKAGMTASVRLQ